MFEKIKQNKLKISIIIGIIIFLLFFSVIFATLNMYNESILKNVYIDNINVENMSKEQAQKKVLDNVNDKLNKEIKLKCGEFETSITASQINFKYDIDGAILRACKVGRNGNILKDNYEILKTLIMGDKIVLAYTYDENMLNDLINNINSKIPNAVEESSYYINGDKLIITSGKNGSTVKKDELKEIILDSIKDINSNLGVKDIPIEDGRTKDIDIERIYKEIHKEPQDARIDKESGTIKVIPDLLGIDFAISIDDVKGMLKEEKDEYEIPLIVKQPNIHISDLGEDLFETELSKYITRYDASNVNRATNIELATNKINGRILMPGETFSFNKAVGERTEAGGYKIAAVYSGGTVVNGIGGGICQVSSTLYNSVILANLDIIERTNHHFLTSYVTPGRDATVSWGTLDFKFKNTRSYPIRIDANAKNGIVSISIKGIKEKVEYEVVIQTKIIEYIEPKVKYEDDSTLQAGQEVVTRKGSKGCISETYKVLKVGDSVISQSLLSKDTYNQLEKVIKKGTANTNQSKDNFNNGNVSVDDEFGQELTNN